MWSNAQTTRFASSSLMNDFKHLKRGDTIYAVDHSDSVVAALVGWVLRWLCHQQPDSSVADSSSYRSCAEPLQEPKSGIGLLNKQSNVKANYAWRTLPGRNSARRE